MLRTPETPYLTGNYAPVADETTIRDLPVDGTIPEPVLGRYVRTGPNPIGTPARPYVWTDGDGMVHELTLAGPRSAAYRNRWVATDRVSSLLGTEPLPGGGHHDRDVANTHVVAVGRRTLCVGRTALYELGLDLATVRRIDVGIVGCRRLGRPRRDERNGEVHLVASSARARSVLHLTLTSGGELVEIRQATSGDPPHDVRDFLVTQRWVVLFSERAVGVWGRTADRVDWIPLPTRSRAEPIAAADRDGAVTVMIADPHLERWTIAPRRRAIHRERLRPLECSFGSVNSRHAVDRLPRFVCAIERGALPFDGTAIVKHDLLTRTTSRKDFGTGRHPGEFVFVDDPDRRAEDGGWLVGLVHDDHTALAELVVLDAGDLRSPPIATVHTTRRVPYGLHGSWTPVRTGLLHH